MAATQLTASSISAKGFASFEGLRFTSNVKIASFTSLKQNSRSFRGLVVKASTTVTPKHTSVKPLGDRVLVKIKAAEEKTSNGILLPKSTRSKPQRGEVIAIGDGCSIAKTELEISVKNGAKVVYSRYAGTEVEVDGSIHLILNEDDIIGITETNYIKDLQPLNDRVLIKVAEAEEKTEGGLYLSQAVKDLPSVGTVVATGPGPLGPEGTRKPLPVSPGNKVMYSKYAGNDFKGADGEKYVTLRASDIIALLPANE